MDHDNTENIRKSKKRYTSTNDWYVNNDKANKAPLNVNFDKIHGHLSLEGALWDKIELLHAPFVHEVRINWENGTHFMVAISQCRKMELDNYSGPNLYSTKGK
jgi:hypothetical protein